MTSLVEPEPGKVVDDINTPFKPIDSNVGHKNRQRKHILKSKENTYKHKCNKLLKRKLKKYRLRQDGAEDQDVLDVSNILVSSLIIKSPNSVKHPTVEQSELCYFDELRPKNYLFKMVRRKESIEVSTNVNSPNINIKHNENIEVPDTLSSQERKHMNAFQLLMDSRNKSIGGNSPGKEKNEELENEEMLEKKNIKVKRNLLLQKMAEAKGSLKNKEMEEIQDKIIKKKMDKRAERLKLMIFKEIKPAKLNETLNQTEAKKDDHPNSNHVEKDKDSSNTGSNKQAKSWKIVDIFNTLEYPTNKSPDKKDIPKEDKEFLKKLSPSLKKKESMLSYFKKVDKEPESLPIDLENDNIIKVKLHVKSKKKIRKKKLSLKRDTMDTADLPKVNDENSENVTDFIAVADIVPESIEAVEETVTKHAGDRLKRKRNSTKEIAQSSEAVVELNNESRPKRATKRPVKYTDDAYLSSSDDELHIFTPKKKKPIENMTHHVATPNSKPKQNISESVKPNKEKKMVKTTNTDKKPVKLAPIFASKQLDPAALEAKQKFLQSGVPEKLKKISQLSKNNDKLSRDFPVVVHIQQKDSIIENNCHPLPNIIDSDIEDDINTVICKEDMFTKLLVYDEVSQTDVQNDVKKSTHAILKSIKQLQPRFPVYRTFRYLRGKGKGEFKDCITDFDNSIEVMTDVVDVISDSPDRLNWTDKYKAMSANQIIGNFETIKELRKWLVLWTENELKSRCRGNPGSDSSDYYQSDTDSRESLKTMNNLLILTGPTGSGKTSSVYAVAAELAMKVIEVNASSKRTGKIMLQDLQEATQSHKVNRGTNTDSSQKSQEKNLTELLKKNKKRGRPKKSVEKSAKKSLEKIETPSSTLLSQESTRTDTSLILIDDADIVFEQDDGFSSAIVQLVQCSKRPIILITSTLLCSHLQRFLQNGKVLKMSPLSPRLLGTWLDIMCVADSGVGWPGVGAKFLDYFKGDIRKTINYLQFYVSSYSYSLNSEEETASQNVDDYKINIDDETSNMSWADQEDLDERKLVSVGSHNFSQESNTLWTDFIKNNSNLFNFRYPLKLFNIWWNVPHLLSSKACDSVGKLKNKNKRKEIKELEILADTIDAISLSDYTTHGHSNTSSDITTGPWYSPVTDSVSEQDTIDYYMNKYEIGDEISHTLVTGYIATAQKVFNCDKKSHLEFPEMTLQRERDKVVSRHNSLSAHLNPWSILDRRSLALDYWSTCRTICRLEKTKSDANLNTKRNNRFCHYLKSLNVLCKSDTFDNLCDSLSSERTELNIASIKQ